MSTLAENGAKLAPEGERVVLSGISWGTYESLVAELEAAGRHVKMTYDDGDLEMQMPTRLHEIIIEFLRSLVEQYCVETGVNFMPTGATTWKRRQVQKGLEADASYYFQHVDVGESATDENLDRCPPPDLAIETEVTRPLVPKLPVYAALGVGEIWHIKADLSAKILLLDGGSYHPADHSIAAPLFTPQLLTLWLGRRMAGEHFKTLIAFRSEVLGLPARQGT